MQSHNRGAVLTLAILAGALAGFGAWQFGGVGLGGGEHEEHETVVWQEAGEAGAAIERLVAESGGRIVEVEQEREDGRAVYEVKFVDAQGGRHKVHVDAATGQPLSD